MSYAAGRVINDADSHIMESLDWLSSHADPCDPRPARQHAAGGRRLGRREGDRPARSSGSRTPPRQRRSRPTWSPGPKGWAAYRRDRSRRADQGAGRPRLLAPAGVHHLRRLAVPALARPGGEVRRRAGAEPGDGRLLRRRQAPDRRRRRAAGRPGARADRDRRGDQGRRRARSGSRPRRRANARPAIPTSTRSGARLGRGGRALRAARWRGRRRRCRPPTTRTAIRGRRTGWAAARTCAPRTISRCRFAPQNFLCRAGAGRRVRPLPGPARRGDRAGRRLGAGLAAPAGPGLEGLAQDRPGGRRRCRRRRRSSSAAPCASRPTRPRTPGRSSAKAGPSSSCSRRTTRTRRARRTRSSASRPRFEGLDEDAKDRFYRRNFEDLFAA